MGDTTNQTEAESRVDIYQRVTDSIVATIEAGAGKWQMPWHSGVDGMAPVLPVTLVLDLDQQANLSYTLEGHLGSVDAVQLFKEETRIPASGHVTVARATDELLEAERVDQYAITVFRDSVQANAPDYDICIIDTPPILGLRTFAALLAADAVLAPIELGDYSLTGVQRLMQSIKGVANHYGRPEPHFLGLLASKFDRRSPRERALFEGLAAEIGGLLFPGVMTKRDVYARAASERIPVWMMKGAAGRDAGDEIPACSRPSKRLW